MIRSIKGTALAFALVCSVYWGLAYFVPGATMIEVGNAFAVGFAAVAALAWSSTAYQAAKRGIADARELFILGLFIGQVALAGRGAWSLLYRQNDQPYWMLDHPMFGFISFLLALSSGLYIFAPGTTEGGAPPRNWLMVSMALALGSMVLGFMLGQKASQIVGLAVVP